MCKGYAKTKMHIRKAVVSEVIPTSDFKFIQYSQAFKDGRDVWLPYPQCVFEVVFEIKFYRAILLIKGKPEKVIVTVIQSIKATSVNKYSFLTGISFVFKYRFHTQVIWGALNLNFYCFKVQIFFYCPKYSIFVMQNSERGPEFVKCRIWQRLLGLFNVKIGQSRFYPGKFKVIDNLNFIMI